MAAESRATMPRAAQLFEAGCELFVERGYHDVGVADITDRIGVSSGTFYNYYPNKRGLLDAIMRTQMDAYAEVIGRVDRSVSSRGDFIAAFQETIRLILARVAENPQLSSFLALTAPGVDRDSYAFAMQAFSAFGTMFAEFFEYGRSRGWVRDDISITVAGRAAASCIIMAVFPLLLGDGEDLDVDEVSRVVATYLLGGMRSA